VAGTPQSVLRKALSALARIASRSPRRFHQSRGSRSVRQEDDGDFIRAFERVSSDRDCVTPAAFGRGHRRRMDTRLPRL
jgi:hypothetical protein